MAHQWDVNNVWTLLGAINHPLSHFSTAMCAWSTVPTPMSFYSKQLSCTSRTSCYSSLLLQHSSWLLYPLLEKFKKDSDKFHNLLLSCESRMWLSIWIRETSYNGKSSSPGRGEPENVMIYPTISCPSPRKVHWISSKSCSLFCWKEAEQRGKFSKKVSSLNSRRCTWCILVSGLLCGTKTALWFCYSHCEFSTPEEENHHSIFLGYLVRKLIRSSTRICVLTVR